MSHSDSELKNDLHDKIRKQMQIQFKATKRIRTPQEFKAFKEKMTPFYRELRFIDAVNTHNTEEVKKLLKEGVSPNTTDSEFRSALHLAVTKEYTDIVQLLLNHGADPNKRDLVYNTPLHLAACIHNLPIVTMLINSKADVRSLDSKGRNPLDLATSKLRILLRNLRTGTMETLKLKEQLYHVVELLLSFFNRAKEQKPHLLESAQTLQLTQLELMKISITSGDDGELDDKMSQLLGDIENMRIT